MDEIRSASAAASACRQANEDPRMKMFITQRPPVATIVEYSDQKEAVNRYPHRIVSPPVPGPCCSTGMEQVGAQQREREWPFVYMRCRGCGYTVRRFGCPEALSLCLLPDNSAPAAAAISESGSVADTIVPRDPWQAEQGEAPGAQSEPVGGSSGWGVGSTSWAA